MFGIVRRKSRSQLVRQELGQSVEHFKQAATHAARGTGETVGPKYASARDRVQPAAGRVKDVASTGWGSAVATLAPLAAAAGDTVRKADKNTRKSAKDSRKAAQKNQQKLQKKTAKAMNRKQSGGKKSKLTSLLFAGAAVGAAATYLVRRRNTQKWDEYDPSRPVTSSGELGTGTTAADDVVFEPTQAPGTTAFTPSSATTETGTTARIDPTSSELGDQTSSPAHSPNVARMAGGSTPNS